MNESDVALSGEGLPALVLDGKRYPLCFTIAGMKAWAERKSQSFEEVMLNGWRAADLKDGDFEFLLDTALGGGHKRASLFSADLPEVTVAVQQAIQEVASSTEILLLLVAIWNEPPGSRPADPQRPERKRG